MPGSFWKLALRGGEKVGYLAGYARAATPLRPVKVAELQSMYADEGERNRGAGGRLVEEFFAWARDRGLDRVSVSAYAANENALRFYRRFDFSDRSVSLERAL